VELLFIRFIGFIGIGNHP